MFNKSNSKQNTKTEKIVIITKKDIVVFFTILLLMIALGLFITKSSHKSLKNNSVNSSTSSNSEFKLSSDAGSDGGVLPIEYTCDGSSATPALSWSNAPNGTKEFALTMTTIPVDGSTKWSWVVYHIPNSTKSLVKNSSGVGTVGVGSHFATASYQPPCSKGPGLNKYTFTLYALSSTPDLPSDNLKVTGEVLSKAISGITIGTANLSLSFQRSQ